VVGGDEVCEGQPGARAGVAGAAEADYQRASWVREGWAQELGGGLRRGAGILRGVKAKRRRVGVDGCACPGEGCSWAR
jgi:hypothetical protein